MPAWSLFICLVLFGSCEGFLFNVSRGAERVSRDLFSNMDPSGTCPRMNDGGRSWCLSKNAQCSQQGCCMCVCSYQYSTFRMDSSVNTATCVENSAFRNFAGKLRWWFRNFRLLYNNNIKTCLFSVFLSPLGFHPTTPKIGQDHNWKDVNSCFHASKIEKKTVLTKRMF